ncbi:enoyl-CoA hydratase [Platysternon megacephalum]|uniref:NADH dehydrogenase [ubiquinone] iron-sulfur protein 3, mitochondrial n=1 Tax=Platysternon megacephalum TaxID=55544 RepID=A0A4D9DK59_9SAUR|nr:enoyl-CoA hydratase [Platysternon megacephalum]
MAAHDDVDAVRVVYSFTLGADVVELAVRVPNGSEGIPSIADLSHPGGRFEREIRDLFGVTPVGHPLPKRLVRHDNWPVGHYPMLRDVEASPAFQPATGDYPFVQVTGDGVYEIPVGPIHAGLIEPGHFRFSVVGESILRMKARLWFLYRGVEKVFEGRQPADSIALAERISGDTAVGHALAYARAVEAALGLTVSPGVDAVRLTLVELERLHNHVADIGMIFNDVAYGIANAHCQVQRERLLRHHAQLTGHRLLRGGITLGRVRLVGDVDLTLLADVGAEVANIVEMALLNRVVQDRLTGTSVLSATQAKTMQTLGFVARASGLAVDARLAESHPLLADFEPIVETDGDVKARLMVRVREVQQSLELIAKLASSGLTSSTGASPDRSRCRWRTRSCRTSR